MVKKIIHYVENLCTIPCITTCKFQVKQCGLFHPIQTNRVKLHFPTYLFNLSHLLSHHPLTPIYQLSFPLFHRTYYYHYNINILERN